MLTKCLNQTRRKIIGLQFSPSTGLLDADEPFLEDLEEDEVLLELEKRQAELKALSAHNRAQKEKLIALTTEQMKKQEIQKKIRAADNEVRDCFEVSNWEMTKEKVLVWFSWRGILFKLVFTFG